MSVLHESGYCEFLNVVQLHANVMGCHVEVNEYLGRHLVASKWAQRVSSGP